MLLLSCTSEKVETNGLKDVSERHASQLNIHQLIDALLICAKNDTTKVCYALVMPKQSLIRLSKGETYPTETSFKKVESFLLMLFCLTMSLLTINRNKMKTKKIG